MSPANKEFDFLEDHPYYKQVRGLNRGSFGVVLLALDTRYDPPQKVAVKMLPRGENITEYVEAEIMNHRMLRHDHVVEFKEVFLTRDHLCIAMEYGPGGDLHDYVERNNNSLSEDEARWFFQQLIIAVDYCHKKEIAVRDIKLDNLVLDRLYELPLLKMCDFGYSKSVLFQALARSRVGTTEYMAPEVALIPNGPLYDGKIADVWSCGVVLYAMMTGAFPFRHMTGKGQDPILRAWKMTQRVVDCYVGYPFKISRSPELLDLMMKIFVVEPQERITIEGILKHPWFRKNLPEGAMEMNKKCLHLQRKETQTEEEIRQILKDAKSVPGAQNSKLRRWPCACLFGSL